jgi:two-component system cell cycle response regulator DivK
MSDYTVLIVEDNPNNRMIMRDMMEVQGHRTLEAVDGPAGLDMAVRHRPDLILMDVQLPGMDGYEVTRRLKAQEETKGIPIIAVTSFAMKGEEDRAREAGCDAYLSKPIDIHKLVETVKSFLDTKDAK